MTDLTPGQTDALDRLSASIASLAERQEGLQRLAEMNRQETERLLGQLDEVNRRQSREVVLLQDALECARIEARWDDPDVADDLDSMRDPRHPSTLPLPEIGDLLTLDELPVGSYVRVGNDDFLYVGHDQFGVMTLVDDSEVSHQYPSTVGETFVYCGDVIA